MKKSAARKTPKRPQPILKKAELRIVHRDIVRAAKQAKKKLFLQAFAKYGTIGAGCEAAGIRRERYYDWTAQDPVFAKQCEAAKIGVGDLLEKEVIRRGVEGEERGIYNKQGELVDTVFEKSDSLLMFATKRHRPEYREKYELPVIPVGPTTITNNVQLNITQLPDSKLAEFIELSTRLLDAPAAPGSEPVGVEGARPPDPSRPS